MDTPTPGWKYHSWWDVVCTCLVMIPNNEQVRGSRAWFICYSGFQCFTVASSTYVEPCECNSWNMMEYARVLKGRHRLNMVRANHLLISAGFWIRPKSSWYMETELQMTMTISVPKIASLFDFHALPNSSESKNADISPGCICGGDWIRCRGAQLRSGRHLLRKTLAFLKLRLVYDQSHCDCSYSIAIFFRRLRVGILRWLDKIALEPGALGHCWGCNLLCEVVKCVLFLPMPLSSVSFMLHFNCTSTHI